MYLDLIKLFSANKNAINKLLINNNKNIIVKINYYLFV